VNKTVNRLPVGKALLFLILSTLILSTGAALAQATDQGASGLSGSQPDTMTFEGVPPKPELAFITGNAWVLYASGPIDEDAARRLEAYLTSHHVPLRSHIYLDSPGGNLSAGMELGRVIRKYELTTDVGARTSGAPTRHDVAPGGCFSSCALAFLGGRFRYLMKDSHYGVHRFAFRNPAPNGVDIAQMASAAIVQYLRDLDIDTRLFTFASSAGESEIFEPTRSQLKELNVVNDGETRATWTIESIPDGIYLKGERDTVFGINKFILTCESKRIGLLVIFDPRHHEEEVLRFTVDYLVLDGFRVRIDHARSSRGVRNGWINAAYRLTEPQISAIAKAKTVGVEMLLTADASIFFGFDAMPVGSGADKIKGFIRSCRGS
jgi:hypothetical protein